MCSGYVNKIIKSSIVDGFGNRLCIFMQGCNFDCWYCHNPETIETKVGMVYSPEELMKEISQYLVFVDGITFSGGEVLLQQDFLLKFLKLLDGKCNVLVDTNGSVLINEEIIKLVDGFILDVKCVCNKEHINLTSKSNEMVLVNLKKLGEVNKLYEVRTVLYPGYDHTHTLNYVKSNINNSVIYREIEYHSYGVREEFARK